VIRFARLCIAAKWRNGRRQSVNAIHLLSVALTYYELGGRGFKFCQARPKFKHFAKTHRNNLPANAGLNPAAARSWPIEVNIA